MFRKKTALIYILEKSCILNIVVFAKINNTESGLTSSRAHEKWEGWNFINITSLSKLFEFNSIY